MIFFFFSNNYFLIFDAAEAYSVFKLRDLAFPGGIINFHNLTFLFILILNFFIFSKLLKKLMTFILRFLIKTKKKFQCETVYFSFLADMIFGKHWFFPSKEKKDFISHNKDFKPVLDQITQTREQEEKFSFLTVKNTLSKKKTSPKEVTDSVGGLETDQAVDCATDFSANVLQRSDLYPFEKGVTDQISVSMKGMKELDFINLKAEALFFGEIQLQAHPYYNDMLKSFLGNTNLESGESFKTLEFLRKSAEVRTSF